MEAMMLLLSSRRIAHDPFFMPCTGDSGLPIGYAQKRPILPPPVFIPTTSSSTLTMHIF